MRLGIIVWAALCTLCWSYFAATRWVFPRQVPVGIASDAVAYVSRPLFLASMLGALVVLNLLLAVCMWSLSRDSIPGILKFPWHRYWLATPSRQTRAVGRLREVILVGGFLVNSSWLIAYHLVVQQLGAQLFIEIPPRFGLFLLVIGAVVILYSLVVYLRPP